MDAQAVDIVDQTESGQLTFEDIINRDAPDGFQYRQGAIIGPDLADLTNPKSVSGSAFEQIPVEDLARAVHLLSMNGLTNLGDISLSTTAPELLRGRTAAQVIGAAALISTAKMISSRHLQRGERVPLVEAATLLDTTTADLMLTAHRMRVGMQVYPGTSSDAPRHYFSGRSFERLRARYSNS